MIKPIYFNVQDRTPTLSEPKSIQVRLENQIAMLQAEADELAEARDQAAKAEATKREELRRLLFIQQGG